MIASVKGTSVGNAKSLKRRERGGRRGRKRETPTQSLLLCSLSALRVLCVSTSSRFRGQGLARIQRGTPPSCSLCASWSTDSCEGRVIYHEAHEVHEGRLRQSSSRTCHPGSLRTLVRRCSIIPTRRHTKMGCALAVFAFGKHCII